MNVFSSRVDKYDIVRTDTWKSVIQKLNDNTHDTCPDTYMWIIQHGRQTPNRVEEGDTRGYTGPLHAVKPC